MNSTFDDASTGLEQSAQMTALFESSDPLLTDSHSTKNESLLPTEDIDLLSTQGLQTVNNLSTIDSPGSDPGQTLVTDAITAELESSEQPAVVLESDRDSLTGLPNAQTDTASAIAFADTAGVFIVGESGQIDVDFLFDGGRYESTLALFSLKGMDAFEPSSNEFAHEAIRRAMSNSVEGHIAISDRGEGAKFDGIIGAHERRNWNGGDYLGRKTFEMTAGDLVGLMLVPEGTLKDLQANPNGERPMFSISAANPDGANQMARLVDISADGNTFAFEDIALGRSDSDFNDFVFQLTGAIAQAPNLETVINPKNEWRNSEAGEELFLYAASNENGPLENMGGDLAETFAQYQTYLRQGNNDSPFESDNFLLQLNDDKVAIDAITSSDSNDLLTTLRELGLERGAAYGAAVSGLLPIQAISKVAALEDLAFARAAYTPLTNIGAADAGAAASQIDGAIDSGIARQNFNVTGAGVTVGVISDSYDSSNNDAPHANAGVAGPNADVAGGDLPGQTNNLNNLNPVNVLADGDGSDTDEGRAMLQLVHDVAPGANLAFHTGSFGQANFARAIDELANAGADIIVDDLTYFAEPMFQDGLIAQSVDDVVDRGVTYFTSAGNSANNGYQSPFVSSGQNIEGATAHNFSTNGGTDIFQQITVPGNANIVISLQWDSPFLSAGPESGGASSDLNVYLYDGTQTQILDSGTDRNIGRDAVEVVRFTNPTPTPTIVNLVVTNPRGGVPSNLKYVISTRNGVNGALATIDDFPSTSPNSSTVYGHHAATGAIAVGSIRYDQGFLANNSSVGPSTILLDTSGNRLNSPDVRQKPEIVAPHGTNTTFFPNLQDNNGDGFPDSDFEQDTFPNFFGTSAAAPHAAGLAALMLEAVPGTPPDILLRALQNSADNTIFGPAEGTGSGLIQANDAIQELERIQATPEINISVPNLTITPAHDEERGDREFGGNGPRIRIQSQAVEKGSAIEITGNVAFEETKSGDTFFGGDFTERIDLSEDYPGFVIDQILKGGGLDVFETTEVNLYDNQIITQDSSNLVERYEVQGDTRQRGFRGSDTPSVSISFHPIRLRLRTPSGELIEDTFLMPDIASFEPNKVKGDREFEGHGPRIDIETEIFANGSLLTPRVIATFEEWENGQPKRNFTTFAQTSEFDGIDVAARYPGHTIDAILSDSRDTLDTVDSERNDQQKFSFDSDNLVREYELEGDSSGDDDPYATLSFNPIRVKLRPL